MKWISPLCLMALEWVSNEAWEPLDAWVSLMRDRELWMLLWTQINGKLLKQNNPWAFIDTAREPIQHSEQW